MARRMRAASVLAVSSSIENRRPSPKRHLASSLLSSTALCSQESQYVCRLIFVSVWSAFLRPKGPGQVNSTLIAIEFVVSGLIDSLSEDRAGIAAEFSGVILNGGDQVATFIEIILRQGQSASL